MSFIVTNRATDKQIKMLKKLEYYGDLNITVGQAATLIDELFEQERLDRDWFDGNDIDYVADKEIN